MSKLSDAIENLKVRNKQEVFPKGPEPDTKEQPKLTKDMFWRVFKDVLGVDKYIISSNNKKVAYTTFKYFLQIEDFNKYKIISSVPDLKKGLLIYGTNGIGKSFLFDSLHKVGRELLNYGYNDFWFNQISAISFVEDYMKLKADFNLQDYYRGVLYIDDLGLEKKAFNKNELIGELLFERHRRGKKTFVTTNIDPNEIHLRYGNAIGDRLPEMFNIIKWEGESWRK